MTLSEIKSCAAETLSYFIQTMPDVPFAANGVIFDFAQKKDMAKRAKALCERYVPYKVINESQAKQLNETIAANALIGRETSAVIVRINHKTDKRKWRQIFFHELMHIYCTKTEMDGEHFIDIYGSGHTPDLDPEDKIYDGCINAGYHVWSEFVAQYYTLLKTEERTYTFPNVVDYVYGLLCEVSIATDKLSKDSFAMACAYLLTCKDVGEILNPPGDTGVAKPDAAPHEKENNAALLDCLRFLSNHLQNEKPWKITESFIETLGNKFLSFKITNTLYMGHLDSCTVEELLNLD